MTARRWLRTAAWVLLFVALGAAAASWFTPAPELSADDAAELVLGALDDADVRARLAGEPRRAEHRTAEGEQVEVWVVRVRARGPEGVEPIELRVQRSAGRLVYVDDRIGPDDTEQLLTDEQFAVLGDHRDDDLADRWALRNGLGGLSALVIAGAGYVLATRSDPLWSQP